MTTPTEHPSRPTRLAQRYDRLRSQTVALAAPLSEADCQVQSMPDTSPAKWHLAHVTWFFETFILERFEPAFRAYDPAFRVLFNSYYQAVGAQHPRPQRGLITRPGLGEVLAYRTQVDERMARLLDIMDGDPMLSPMVELGLQHEQQHQELLLTDIKHLLSCNPINPVYHAQRPQRNVAHAAPAWLPFQGGRVEIGHGNAGFAFDNESPRHAVLLRPYALANRLVTHGDWLHFIDDGGYRDSRWWLAAGWDWLRQQGVEAPLYWQHADAGGWTSYALHGRASIDPHTPVPHLSYYEADAYARWRSAQDKLPLRLPTEAEWEHAAEQHEASARADGNFLESGELQPVPLSRAGGGLHQLFGDVWEWTASSYLPYPGFRPWDGTVGEYNGKFMVNQMVLRGGSCATPASHVRTSYRNFFPTDARWQFNGLRLACDG